MHAGSVRSPGSISPEMPDFFPDRAGGDPTPLEEPEGGVLLAGGFGVMAHGSALTSSNVEVACRIDPDNLLSLSFLPSYQSYHSVVC